MSCRKLKKDDIVWFNSVGIKKGDKGTLHYYISSLWNQYPIYFSSTEPSSPSTNDVWENISNGEIKIYNGSAWNNLDINILNSGKALLKNPDNPNNKDGYYDPDCFVSVKANETGGSKLDYGTEQEGVAYSLKQRLSIIRGELWYQKDYGLPLLYKLKDKAILDSVIYSTITSHPEVRSITSWSSGVDKNTHEYYFKANIDTIYNESIEIGSSYIY